jgi:hypothetical protein
MTPQYMIEIKKKNRRKMRKKLANKNFRASNQSVLTTTTEIGPQSNVTITEQPTVAANKEATIVDMSGVTNTSSEARTLKPSESGHKQIFDPSTTITGEYY